MVSTANHIWNVKAEARLSVARILLSWMYQTWHTIYFRNNSYDWGQNELFGIIRHDSPTCLYMNNSSVLATCVTLNRGILVNFYVFRFWSSSITNLNLSGGGGGGGGEWSDILVCPTNWPVGLPCIPFCNFFRIWRMQYKLKNLLWFNILRMLWKFVPDRSLPFKICVFHYNTFTYAMSWWVEILG